jgi:catechol 2,3-dioxygenase-like lactoylglutathione lyase family enzyme
MAIKGVHAMFFTDQAQEAREFLRDKLGLPCFPVGDQGWLIFELSEADLGVHPVDPQGGPPVGTHNISFYCDDIEAEVASLTDKGVETTPIEDQGFGLVTQIEIPGGIKVTLYQPEYK